MAMSSAARRVAARIHRALPGSSIPRRPIHASSASPADQRQHSDRSAWHNVSAGPADHYRILNIPHHATKAEVKRAYLLMAKKHHPDVSDSTSSDAMFRAAAEAYETLGDDAKRREYDEERLGSSIVAEATEAEAEARPGQRRPRTAADLRRKNEPWNTSVGGAYTRAEHEAAFRDAMYGTMERIRMERQMQGTLSRENRERVHVPSQAETVRSLVGRPLAFAAVVAVNCLLAMGYFYPQLSPLA